MAAKYHNLPQNDRDYDLEAGYEEGHQTPGVLLRFFSHVCTVLSYTAFLLFLPVTYWICIKKVDSAHRIIIFRLGTLIGSRGPGRVLTFPWIDRTLTIDVSNSAFSVPPQQLITHDGGIIEIGAEVHYAVTDCVALVSQVCDYQEMLRSLAKTVLIRLTVKQTIAQLNKDKHKCENSVKDDINGQVRKWGLDIRLVEFCEIKVLKVPEKEGGIPPLLATLSRSSGSITPAEFAQYIYSTDLKNKEAGQPVTDNLKSMVEAAEVGKVSWLSCFQRMLQLEKFDAEEYGRYIFILTDIFSRICVDISDTPTAYDIDDDPAICNSVNKEVAVKKYIEAADKKNMAASERKYITAAAAAEKKYITAVTSGEKTYKEKMAAGEKNYNKASDAHETQYTATAEAGEKEYSATAAAWENDYASKNNISANQIENTDKWGEHNIATNDHGTDVSDNDEYDTDDQNSGMNLLELDNTSNNVASHLTASSSVISNLSASLTKDLPTAHITISLTSSDLAGILKGSLPSLQAFLTNRINVSGDVRKLMLLEKFGTKVYKPGQPFSV
jgi:putative sterol carrier protein